MGDVDFALLERHARRYPRSARAQEREALTIQALALEETPAEAARPATEAPARGASPRRTVIRAGREIVDPWK